MGRDYDGLQLARLLFLRPELLLPEAVKQVRWALMRIDDDDQPIDRIGSLHESVLETDPSGREMRPK